MPIAAKRLEEEINAITECGICFEIFSQPKALPCLHSFCLDCLEQHSSGKSQGSSEICPLCRASFIIPQGGMINLKSNFHVSNLVEILLKNDLKAALEKETFRKILLLTTAMVAIGCLAFVIINNRKQAEKGKIK